MGYGECPSHAWSSPMPHPSVTSAPHPSALTRVPHPSPGMLPHASPTPVPHTPPTLAPGPSLPADVRQQLAHTGSLESPWIWITLAVATALAAVALIWWCRRRPATSWRGCAYRLAAG